MWKTGDVVRLKSGGPAMTVVKTGSVPWPRRGDESDTAVAQSRSFGKSWPAYLESVYCVWASEESGVHADWLPSECLVTAEARHDLPVQLYTTGHGPADSPAPPADRPRQPWEGLAGTTRGKAIGG